MAAMTYSHPILFRANASACRVERGACAVDLLVASSAADDAAFTPPEWVHLIPAGVFSGRDGRGPYRLDAEAVLAVFAAHGADLPVDYDHQSLSAEDKAGPVPAAGWIKELAAREDGIWARVEWTPAASQHLLNKEYRYLSPVFRHDKQGRVVALEGAGLTHNPNLYLKAAASRKETNAVEDLIERLIMMLNLPAASTPEDVVAELQKIIDRLTTAEAAAAQARQPDPAEWVPMSQHRTVAEQLAALQAQIAAEKAEAAVTAAMRAGKLAPAMKDWALSYASKDPEGFAQWTEKSPVILPPETDRAAQRVASNADTLTEEDRIACALLGIPEGDFAAHKKTITVKE
ncbi:phage I-like protein [Sulfuritortus calidifontis]|uniref:Phage I-like protein n=1 Tax=Sulfuritortus calidifontis TaxID=1914471 RepID=A0A4R3JUI0_9PROT|nr:phage protease [Sulfuritortus calidifontis]TCS69763.1 phage I-like protein [Sulfuritortus calidifontis]